MIQGLQILLFSKLICMTRWGKIAGMIVKRLIGLICRCGCIALLSLGGGLQAMADAVDDYVTKTMPQRAIPGLALEVIQNGQPVKMAGYGMANLEWQIPVTPETVFEIGSATKQFTAAGIMLLAQDGKLSVDEKLSRYIPNTPESWTNITLRHLLTHTSGIRNYTGLSGFEYTRHLTQAQFIKRMSGEPLTFQPGERWVYCNTGFSLLGYVIENVSGESYWRFMQERVFGPLGMTHTTSRNPGVIIPHRASGYEGRNGNYQNRDYDITDIFSAGAIVSTVGDIAKWDEALDEDHLLTAASKKEMWTSVRLNDGAMPPRPYGFGWYVETLDGHPNIGHSGTTDGFSASNQRFPKDATTTSTKEGLVVIVLTNSNTSGIATTVAKDIARIYFAK
jgi:CubicO group peptidase (beta-lactamase class C family)